MYQCNVSAFISCLRERRREVGGGGGGGGGCGG